MGLGGKLKRFVTGEPEPEEKDEEKKEETPVEPDYEEDEDEEEESSESCALCGGTGAEKKWAGQAWHKRCLRSARKGAKKMI